MISISGLLSETPMLFSSGVHIVGKRRWNRRGAMVTDRYQHIHHHPTVEDFIQWADNQSCTVIGIDNIPGSEAIETSLMPKNCVPVLGKKDPDSVRNDQSISENTCNYAIWVNKINQRWSRKWYSMYEWLRQHSQV